MTKLIGEYNTVTDLTVNPFQVALRKLNVSLNLQNSI